jgi:murein DD-endopeptidase MepM/ murein hydrolase activator NlpD
MTMIHGVLRARYLSSQFGPRINPVTHQFQNHGGLDIPTEVGSPVRAARAGTVGTVVRDHPVAGHYVEVGHDTGYWTRYLHLSRIDVAPGTVLPVGGQIGLSGGGVGIPGAGRTTGPHLHLEVWRGKPYAKGSTPVDPEPLLTMELADVVKAAAGAAVKTGKRAARAGLSALQRNWWIAGLSLGGIAAVYLLFLRPRRKLAAPAAPKLVANRRRRRR